MLHPDFSVLAYFSETGTVPTLEIAGLVRSVAGKGDLGPLPIQDFHNLHICDIAHLVVLFHHLPILITYSSLLFRHHCIARGIGITDIAVYALPPLFAIAELCVSHGAILPICQ